MRKKGSSWLPWNQSYRLSNCGWVRVCSWCVWIRVFVSLWVCTWSISLESWFELNQRICFPLVHYTFHALRDSRRCVLYCVTPELHSTPQSSSDLHPVTLQLHPRVPPSCWSRPPRSPSTEAWMEPLQGTSKCEECNCLCVRGKWGREIVSEQYGVRTGLPYACGWQCELPSSQRLCDAMVAPSLNIHTYSLSPSHTHTHTHTQTVFVPGKHWALIAILNALKGTEEREWIGGERVSFEEKNKELCVRKDSAKKRRLFYAGGKWKQNETELYRTDTIVVDGAAIVALSAIVCCTKGKINLGFLMLLKMQNQQDPMVYERTEINI